MFKATFKNINRTVIILAFLCTNYNKASEISLHVDNCDGKKVISTLLASKGVKCVLPDEISGNVTMHVDNAPLETILQSLLAQLNAGYVKEGADYKLFANNVRDIESQKDRAKLAEYLNKLKQDNKKNTASMDQKGKSKIASFGGGIVEKKIKISMDPQVLFTLLASEGIGIDKLDLHTENTLISNRPLGGGFGGRSNLLGNRAGYGRRPSFGSNLGNYR